MNFVVCVCVCGFLVKYVFHIDLHRGIILLQPSGVQRAASSEISPENCVGHQ